MMKVGYVVKRYPRYSETFIVNEILAHEAAGVEVEIIALHAVLDTHFQSTIAQVRAPVHYRLAAGIRAEHLWTTMREATERGTQWSKLGDAADADASEVYQSLEVASIVRDRGITHLHAHFATVATTVARLAAHFTGVPYSFTAHAKDIFHESVSAERLRAKLRDAAFAVTVSDFNVAHLREQFGSDADRLIRIYNGLDLERFPFQPSQERAPRIVSIGRLVEKKGFDDLIRACAELSRRGVQYSCRIIGTGELEVPLRQLIAELQPNEVTLAGPRPQDEVVDELRGAAVFAGPYVIGGDGNRDGLPTVLIEAMALGTACVATDVTGVPEIVRHDETGVIVPQRTPIALADALEQLLRDGQRRGRFAAAARELVEREFDVVKSTRRLREAFERAAAPSAFPGQRS